MRSETQLMCKILNICRYAYIRSYAYYSVTITLADSLFFDADVYQISVTFYSEAISLVHIKADN